MTKPFSHLVLELVASNTFLLLCTPPQSRVAIDVPLILGQLWSTHFKRSHYEAAHCLRFMMGSRRSQRSSFVSFRKHTQLVCLIEPNRVEAVAAHSAPLLGVLLQLHRTQWKFSSLRFRQTSAESTISTSQPVYGHLKCDTVVKEEFPLHRCWTGNSSICLVMVAAGQLIGRVVLTDQDGEWLRHWA